MKDEAILTIYIWNLLFYDPIMGDRYYYVYILTNLLNTTLYSGVTNNLIRRVDEHKRGVGGVFSRKYHLNRLVYYEVYEGMSGLLEPEEKQIKGGIAESRKL